MAIASTLEQNQTKVSDERGFSQQIKRLLPRKLHRLLTVTYNGLMRPLPFGLKYGLIGWLKRNRAPYRLLQADDVVVQVGSARDILMSGRSRAVHLSRVLTRGRVVVIEADQESCRALRGLIEKQNLDNITLVESGAWNKPTTLAFLSSPLHPAANLLEEADSISEDLIRERRYEKQLIEVDTVDNILARLGIATPKMVCITTNGAELEILEGLRDTIAGGCRYVSLAATGEGFFERMKALGFDYIARDDRGYCFQNEKAEG